MSEHYSMSVASSVTPVRDETGNVNSAIVQEVGKLAAAAGREAVMAGRAVTESVKESVTNAEAAIKAGSYTSGTIFSSYTALGGYEAFSRYLENSGYVMDSIGNQIISAVGNRGDMVFISPLDEIGGVSIFSDNPVLLAETQLAFTVDQVTTALEEINFEVRTEVVSEGITRIEAANKINSDEQIRITIDSGSVLVDAGGYQKKPKCDFTREKITQAITGKTQAEKSGSKGKVRIKTGQRRLLGQG